MRETNALPTTAANIKLIRKYLKLKILEDNISFRNHNEERDHVYDLLKRTILNGESHSALVIGPRGSGKTTLINSVLHQLASEVDLAQDAIIVKLNGLIHHDEKTSLKGITAQMQLENAVGDRVFGTFAENLAFLLECLKSGADRRCKSMVFVLEEFDAFCRGGRTQTLLYNLFDVTHAGQAPMCVLGITNRIDVMELLEKRVLSRFSHRHIMLCPALDCGQVFLQLLTLPAIKKERRKSGVKLDPENAVPETVLQRCGVSAQEYPALEPCDAEEWNCHVASLAEDQKVLDALEKFSYYIVNEQVFRNVMFQLVCKLSPSKPYIDAVDLAAVIDQTVSPEQRVRLLQSLSTLELCLLIAALHGAQIFDNQPMNFEMLLHRYTKFANTNSSTQSVPRPVILKAYEHLQALELLVPAGGEAAAQREYRLCALAVPAHDIAAAVAGHKALPTEIAHWLDNRID